MTDQLDLLTWGNANLQEETATLPRATIAPKPLQHDIQPNDIVMVAPMTGSRPFIGIGPVVGLHGTDFVEVDPYGLFAYRCHHSRLTQYIGKISVYRFGSASHCERPQCIPAQGEAPFNCRICGDRSVPLWQYIGPLPRDAKRPQWPSAMWFPENFDPNTEELCNDFLPHSAGHGHP